MRAFSTPQWWSSSEGCYSLQPVESTVLPSLGSSWAGPRENGELKFPWKPSLLPVLFLTPKPPHSTQASGLAPHLEGPRWSPRASPGALHGPTLIFLLLPDPCSASPPDSASRTPPPPSHPTPHCRFCSAFLTCLIPFRLAPSVPPTHGADPALLSQIRGLVAGTQQELGFHIQCSWSMAARQLLSSCTPPPHGSAQ